jgi:hypothetical protein
MTCADSPRQRAHLIIVKWAAPHPSRCCSTTSAAPSAYPTDAYLNTRWPIGICAAAMEGP